jgi:hypothetical protein
VPQGRWFDNTRVAAAVNMPPTPCTTLSFAPNVNVAMGNYVWLPDSSRMIVCVRSDHEEHAKQLWLVNTKGESRELTEGWILGNTSDGRVLFINKDGRNWKVELNAPKPAPAPTTAPPKP